MNKSYEISPETDISFVIVEGQAQIACFLLSLRVWNQDLDFRSAQMWTTEGHLIQETSLLTRALHNVKFYRPQLKVEIHGHHNIW